MLPIEKLGLRWSSAFPGEATGLTPDSVDQARRWRADLMRSNPRAIVLADVAVEEAPVDYLPISSPLWRRAPNGHVDTTMTDTGIRGHLKFDRPAFRKLTQKRTTALMETGVVDGVALRAWSGDSPPHLALVQAVRRGVGRSGVIVLESGVGTPALCAPYVNGLIVVDDGKGRPVWPQFAEISTWAREHIRKPGFTVLEAFASHDRARLYEMRMATTLALVFGDGFVTFADSTGHDWYDFWAQDLGRPLRPAYRKDGAYRREFENGTAVFNPPTNKAVVLDFLSNETSMAKSLSATRISVQPGDGDIALSRPPAH